MTMTIIIVKISLLFDSKWTEEDERRFPQTGKHVSPNDLKGPLNTPPLLLLMV